MTVEQVERIAQLVASLAPLRGKQRGMRIEAEDWNTLVTTIVAILEIDRRQEEGLGAALADAYAPRTHDHLGSVSLPWLEPDLQTRVGGAGSSLSILVGP